MKADSWNRDAILAVSSAYRECAILNAAVELDLFTHLSRKPLTAIEIARRTHADRRGVETLLHALAAMGLVRKTGARFRAAPQAAALLASDAPESIAPMVAHNAHLQKSWSRLAEVVRTGAPVEPFGGKARSGETLHAFIGAMHVRGAEMASRVAAALDLMGVRRVLDVGAGPGTYSMAFLRRAKRLRVTLFDLPPVVAIARRNLGAAGLLERADLAPGDFETDDLPGGHDLAWVSAIIHQQGRAENRALYRKVARALVPGGRIVVRDHILDPSRTRPRAAALFAVNMLVRTLQGGCFTLAEIREDLEKAGFRKVRLLSADDHMNGLVEGVKASSRSF